MQLRERERKLALRNIKASRLFDGFVSNLEQNDMPDQETYKEL